MQPLEIVLKKYNWYTKQGNKIESYKMLVYPRIPIITLIVNSLNRPNKRQILKVDKWI